jgi:hypothetical protein
LRVRRERDEQQHDHGGEELHRPSLRHSRRASAGGGAPTACSAQSRCRCREYSARTW